MKNIFINAPFCLASIVFIIFCGLQVCNAQNSIIYNTDNQLDDPFEKLCSLSVTNTWQEFQFDAAGQKYHHDRWAWMWSVTLKSKTALKLHQLTLQWIGKKIDKLYASLYQKKECDPILIPIQDNLIGEGVWNPVKQQLTFHLNQKIVARNEYSLVLSFPQKIEQLLRDGKFALPPTEPFIVSRLW
jgi:hypothetical protein